MTSPTTLVRENWEVFYTLGVHIIEFRHLRIPVLLQQAFWREIVHVLCIYGARGLQRCITLNNCAWQICNVHFHIQQYCATPFYDKKYTLSTRKRTAQGYHQFLSWCMLVLFSLHTLRKAIKQSVSKIGIQCFNINSLQVFSNILKEEKRINVRVWWFVKLCGCTQNNMCAYTSTRNSDSINLTINRLVALFPTSSQWI